MAQSCVFKGGKKKKSVSDMEKVSSAEEHDGADGVGFSAFPEADAFKKIFS